MQAQASTEVATAVGAPGPVRGRRTAPTPREGRTAPTVTLVDVPRLVAGSIAEAVDRLAHDGFVRSLEPVGFLLWCPSCEASFDPSALVVQSMVTVGSALVLGLHDPVSGARGAWVLRERSERDAWLLARLLGARAAAPAGRLEG